MGGNNFAYIFRTLYMLIKDDEVELLLRFLAKF